jgi:hypothetical protein
MGNTGTPVNVAGDAIAESSEFEYVPLVPLPDP